MTIPASDRRKEYTGNGVTTIFAGPRAFSASHIAVYSIVTATGVATLVGTGLYTLTGVNSNGATTVTMATAPASTVTLLILRTVDYTQETDITNQGAFLPEVIEDGFDALAQQTQQLADIQARSVRLSDTSTYAGSLELPVPQAGYVLGWNSTEDGLENLDPGSEDVSGFVIDASNTNGATFTPTDWPVAAAMTFGAGERFVRSFRNSRTTGDSIYAAIFPAINHYDSMQGVTHIASGSTIEHATGIAGYIRSDDPAPTNGVAVFGCSMATVNSAAVWGLNTLLQDSATRAVGALTGIFLVNELDFNVMCPGTTVIGMSVGGNSLSQPASANGFVANPLGTGILWETAFYSQDAASTNCLAVGAAALSGTNISSQKILMSYFNGSAVKKTMRQQIVAGYLEFEGVDAAMVGYKFLGADISLDTNKGIRVGGNVVVTDRQAGWTAMTGTNDIASAFDTETVTLIQLARRVKALQAAATGHGLIGA